MAALIDDEMVMLALIVLVIDQHVRDDTITVSVVTRPDIDLELEIFVLSHTGSSLAFCPLVHGHLSHCASCTFTTILFEVLCTVLVKRITLVRDLAVVVYDVVPVARAVRLARTTEVDADGAVGLLRNPDVVDVLMRHSSFFGNCPFVASMLLILSLDLFEP